MPDSRAHTPRANPAFAGRGPRGYRRSDARIREEICERLTDDPEVDASEMEVSIEDGVVTLAGRARTRDQKYRAEDIADSVAGVRQVNSLVRVPRDVASFGGALDLTATTHGADVQRPFGDDRRGRPPDHGD